MSLHISIYTTLAHDINVARLQAPQEPSVAEWVLPVDHKSRQTAPFPQTAKFICVFAEVDCAVAFGENPVAEQAVKPVKAGERLYYGVYPGHKLAAIAM